MIRCSRTSTNILWDGGAAASNSGAGTPVLDALPAGEALFANGDLACKACHSLDGANGIGPSLQGVSARVPESYDSPEAYIYESIVEPDAYVREGYHEGIMPELVGQLDDQALADLVAFLAGE